MTQISSYLKLEVAKYKDIDQILNKLESDGEVQNIYNIFKEIFENERDFTMQELSKIEEEKKEEINIHEQCEKNLSMFKSSFSLIMQMILDRAFKSANSRKLSQFTDTTRAETALDQQSDSTIATEESVVKKKTKKRREAASRGSSPNANSRSFNGDSRTGTPKKGKKKGPSQNQSPLARILSPGSTATTNMSFFAKSSVSRAQSPQSQSRSNFHQSQGNLDKSQSFVQSEFNHISGSVVFPKSPKLVEKREFSPGPGAYNADICSLRRSPSPTIDKAPKVCWFDEMAKRNESPGPGGLYPSHHFLSK